MVTYYLRLPPMKGILEKHLAILHVSNRLSLAMKNPPLLVYLYMYMQYWKTFTTLQRKIPV